ncbi:hypothetical protein [Ohtaekwangia koreensis]|jgi:hypothetical protein|uniref:DUF4168 domain-containing protein n=1 Tax=Ohtaekwangia koreensis TaxID=688867 RepID=A0A1T5M3F3_9BACT|nr:hypothetical protein [Ohtaekwangia koreensis]SKC82781.1 hypothetical protein SAMN05660236_4267 [Ohtaekwangia koreensis]
MKLKFFSLVCFMALFSAPLFAQDAAAVTDEELKKYAVAMDSVNEMQAVLTGQIKQMVTTNQTVTAQRYNELFKIIGDEGKLLEANATPDEIRFVKDVIAKKDEGTAKIKETYQLLAKDYVGAAAFNKVKKAISSDESLKSKYQSIMDELAKDNAVN